MAGAPLAAALRGAREEAVVQDRREGHRRLELVRDVQRERDVLEAQLELEARPDEGRPRHVRALGHTVAVAAVDQAVEDGGVALTNGEVYTVIVRAVTEATVSAGGTLGLPASEIFKPATVPGTPTA